MREIAGKQWVDSSLNEWPENDHRLFVGNLHKDVKDHQLAAAFGAFPSFAKGKVVRDRASQKSKGYGFVSFLDMADAVRALKELDGSYIGSRCVGDRTLMDRYRCIRGNDHEVSHRKCLVRPT